MESAQSKRQLCGGSQAAIERMIHFGRELQSMSEHLRRECGKNSANKKMLKVTQESVIYLVYIVCFCGVCSPFVFVFQAFTVDFNHLSHFLHIKICLPLYCIFIKASDVICLY